MEGHFKEVWSVEFGVLRVKDKSEKVKG